MLLRLFNLINSKHFRENHFMIILNVFIDTMNFKCIVLPHPVTIVYNIIWLSRNTCVELKSDKC